MLKMTIITEVYSVFIPSKNSLYLKTHFSTSFLSYFDGKKGSVKASLPNHTASKEVFSFKIGSFLNNFTFSFKNALPSLFVKVLNLFVTTTEISSVVIIRELKNSDISSTVRCGRIFFIRAILQAEKPISLKKLFWYSQSVSQLKSS